MTYPILYLTAEWHVDSASGDVTRHETGNDDNFTQCGNFFRNVLTAAEKERLTDNIAGNLSGTYAVLMRELISACSDRRLYSNIFSFKLITYKYEMEYLNI